MKELWHSMDRDMTGEIDIEEFASNALHDEHRKGLMAMKDQAVDPTRGDVPDHMKSKGNFGLDGPKTVARDAKMKDKDLDKVQKNKESSGLGRPESASTIATDNASRPQSAKPGAKDAKAAEKEAPKQEAPKPAAEPIAEEAPKAPA